MNIYKNGRLIAFLIAFINTPVAASADCTALYKNSRLFEAEKLEMLSELKRAKALNPQPHEDAALCRALLRLMKDVPYFYIAESSCFPDKKQEEIYKTQIEQFGMDAADLASIFCTADEKRRGTSGVKSKVFDGEP